MAPSHRQKLHKHRLRPALGAPQRHNGVDQRQSQQAGRSSTNIHAQVSAQTMREASRSGSREGSIGLPPPPPPPPSPPPPPPPPPAADPSRPDTGPIPPACRPQDATRPPYAPTVPSPLNQGPSDPKRGRKGRTGSAGSAGHASRPGDPHPGGAAAMPVDSPAPAPPPTPVPPQLRVPAISQMDSLSTLSHATPTTVRDLGSDYTRYPNPFATRSNSASTSQQDLSTLTVRLPTYSSCSHLAPSSAVSSSDLAKRLSNPFKDERRLSASMVSDDIAPVEVRPDTPTPEQARDERDKAPAVAVPAVPAQRAGTPAFIRNADPEKVPFFWLDDRLSAPCAFPLYVDQQEEDDDMHMPKWDDDRNFKPSIKDRFSRANVVNTIGVIFLLTGLLTIFVVLPVVSFTGTSLIPYTYETPLDQMPGHGHDPDSWAQVNHNTYPLLQNVRTGLIDSDTPESAMTKRGIDGDDLVLVFSDEFNARNRTFYSGDDPYWFAPELWYGATQDLEWYDPDAVNTGDGTLQLQLDAHQTHGLGYRSGAIHSWNQLCFKGGVFEVSVSLPGPAGVHGLWPGVWTMGNLGRPGYLATTEGMWPYTYDGCDAGITPNQSQPDGTSWLPGQRLPKCACSGEDHPTPGTGRGAPEIDIIEVSADWGGKGYGVATQSYQVAPFDVFYYPNYDFMETPNYNFSYVNTYTGGPFQQAISTTTMLNNQWYDGKAYQKYSFEYAPGSGADAFVAWKVGDDEMMRFDGRAIGPNGNVQARLISEEPMSLILNLGFSHSWVQIDQANLKFPTVMRVDYVRWYQKEGEEMVTCDPPGYETTDYIARHSKAYHNPNLTHWEDAGYTWPRNELMHSCSASQS